MKSFKIPSLLSLGCIVFTLFSFQPASDTTFSYPVKISQDNISLVAEFGERKHPITHEMKMHSGVDFVAPLGAIVMASAKGLVTEVGYDQSGYGKFIVVTHTNGYQTKYAQLSEILVKPHETVTPNTVIGKVGDSGRANGPHLHFEIIQNNQVINPMPLLQ